MIFFVIRALLALIPGLANRHPIKKWVTANPTSPRPSRRVLIYLEKLKRPSLRVTARTHSCYRVG